MPKQNQNDEAKVQTFAILRLTAATVKLYLLGTSALVMNRMPAKAKQQLLAPGRSLNKAARESQLKHNPPAEYRDSVYRCRDDGAPTLVHMPKGAFKKAIAQAAIDTPGATKAEIGRLVKIIDPTVHIFGTPYLYMDVVRQAGIAKTPDIRTRAMFPEWAASIEVQFIKDKIREIDIVNLVSNSGTICGIGDGRTEKGTYDFGSYELVSPNDSRWLTIAKQGRKVQLAALQNPEPIDEDTSELFGWFEQEMVRRERERESKPKKPSHEAIAHASEKKANGRGRRAAQ
jgi:hypothetical protein